MNKQLTIFLLSIFTFGLAQADWPDQSEKAKGPAEVSAVQTIQPRLTQATQGELTPGELLEVRVGDLPANTSSATFALGHGVHGLLMRPEKDGSWSGHFAILPSLAGKTLEPLLTVRLTDGSEFTRRLPSRRVSTTNVKDGDGFMADNGGEVMFVFDETIQMDSVVVVTTSGGVLARPQYENNYFKLPQGVAQSDIEEIRALSIHGEQLEITPRS